MKAILEFNLPEDALSHQVAVRAEDWKSALREVDSWLRDRLKYGHTFQTAEEAMLACRDQIRSQLNEAVLDLYC